MQLPGLEIASVKTANKDESCWARGCGAKDTSDCLEPLSQARKRQQENVKDKVYDGFLT